VSNGWEYYGLSGSETQHLRGKEILQYSLNTAEVLPNIFDSLADR